MKYHLPNATTLTNISAHTSRRGEWDILLCLLLLHEGQGGIRTLLRHHLDLVDRCNRAAGFSKRYLVIGTMSTSIRNRKLARRAKYVAFVAVALLLVSLRDLSAISSDGVKVTIQPFDHGRLACSSYNRHGVPVYDPKEKVTPPTFMGGFISSGEDYWEKQLSRIDGTASLAVIREHPRLFATRERWTALNGLIRRDTYLATWDGKIRRRADGLYHAAPVNYTIDGSLAGSGVLDVAREFQLRIKTWAYVYRLSRHVKWKDRIWEELLVASGNST